MTLQRCLLQLPKQWLCKHSLLQGNIQHSYTVLSQKYSSKANPRQYTDRHEWVVVDKDVGTIGISNYAQESLGDIVFAQLPEEGKNVSAGDEVGALESVKAASEIYSPVSGIITEKNVAVSSKPSLINTNCYDKGWLYKLKLTKLDELNGLMSEKEYEKFLKTDVKEEDS